MTTGRLAVVAVLTLLMGLAGGCDFCIDSPGGSNGESEIFFSALPENGTVESIFSSFENGGRIRERLKNALIFSAPARNGRIAALRYDTNYRKNIVLILKPGNGDSLKIENSLVNADAAYPVISPDGANLTYSENASTLYLYRIDNVVTVILTHKFADNSLPDFSDNGRMLAFFEKTESPNYMKLKVIDLELPYDNWLLFEREFIDTCKVRLGKNTLDFSGDGAGNPYRVTFSDGKQIFSVFPIENQIDSFPEKVLGAHMPVKQPDGSLIAFTADNGNVFVFNPEQQTHIPVTESEPGSENNFYAQWSKNGKKLLCSRYYISVNEDNNYSTLIIIDTETKRASVVGNNVVRGFWKPD